MSLHLVRFCRRLLPFDALSWLVSVVVLPPFLLSSIAEGTVLPPAYEVFCVGVCVLDMGDDAYFTGDKDMQLLV